MNAAQTHTLHARCAAQVLHHAQGTPQTCHDASRSQQAPAVRLPRPRGAAIGPCRRVEAARTWSRSARCGPPRKCEHHVFRLRTRSDLGPRGGGGGMHGGGTVQLSAVGGRGAPAGPGRAGRSRCWPAGGVHSGSPSPHRSDGAERSDMASRPPARSRPDRTRRIVSLAAGRCA